MRYEQTIITAVFALVWVTGQVQVNNYTVIVDCNSLIEAMAKDSARVDSTWADYDRRC